MVDECKNLDAIVFVADLAIHNAYSADGSVGDEWNKTLLRFRHICKLPWLARKDIVIIFLNVEELSRKSSNVHDPSRAHKNIQTRTADDIKKRFTSLDKNELREIHVIFAENEVRAKNLEALERVVKQILSKKATAA